MTENGMQIEYWNGDGGERFARSQEAIDRSMAKITEAAIDFAADKVNLKHGDFDVLVLPEPKTLIDLLNGNDADAKTPIQPKLSLAADSVLRTLSPALRTAMLEQIQMAALLQQRPVILAMPFAISMK